MVVTRYDPITVEDSYGSFATMGETSSGDYVEYGAYRNLIYTLKVVLDCGVPAEFRSLKCMIDNIFKEL